MTTSTQSRYSWEATTFRTPTASADRLELHVTHCARQGSRSVHIRGDGPLTGGDGIGALSPMAVREGCAEGGGQAGRLIGAILDWIEKRVADRSGQRDPIVDGELPGASGSSRLRRTPVIPIGRLGALEREASRIPPFPGDVQMRGWLPDGTPGPFEADPALSPRVGGRLMSRMTGVKWRSGSIWPLSVRVF
jgi:hypothetical protein